MTELVFCRKFIDLWKKRSLPLLPQLAMEPFRVTTLGTTYNVKMDTETDSDVVSTSKVTNAVSAAAEWPEFVTRTYTSFSEFQDVLDAYEQSHFCVFKKKSTSTAQTTNRETIIQIPSEFKYARVEFTCTRYGRHRSRGKGLKASTKMSALGCEASFTLGFDYREFVLRVTKYYLEHNHPTTPDTYAKEYKVKRMARRLEEQQSQTSPKPVINDHLRQLLNTKIDQSVSPTIKSEISLGDSFNSEAQINPDATSSSDFALPVFFERPDDFVSRHYSSFNEFQTALDEYEKQNFCVFRKKTTTTAETANKETIVKVGPEFRYARVHYTCTHYGFHRYRGKGIISNIKSAAIGCEANFTLSFDYRKLILRITKHHLEHNHPTTPETYARENKVKRLSPKELQALQGILSLTPANEQLRQFINTKYGKSLTLKDVRHLKSKLKKTNVVKDTQEVTKPSDDHESFQSGNDCHGMKNEEEDDEGHDIRDIIISLGDHEGMLKSETSPDLNIRNGPPVGVGTAVITAGSRGPALMQDVVFSDEIAHLTREKIPERLVHAKGAGAFGYFEVTHDITQYCKADVFSKVNKRTPVAVRFSTTSGENGSADTIRDPRGFAVKMYTEDGNWDFLGLSTPIFFIRDPTKLPSLVHVTGRNPRTHCHDPDMFWDFMTLVPETMHMLMFLFSDRGTPNGYRHIQGHGINTFKMVNANNEEFYCKFVYDPDQGVKHLSWEEAVRIAGVNPDYAIRDLYNAIATQNYPTWTLYIQVMPVSKAEKAKWNPFDPTKTWSFEEFPLKPVGKLVLNRNPTNYFAEVEQIAFCPAHLVPGIEPSPDKLLQGRLFAYSDAQRYRLGSNYLQLPVNCPYSTRVLNYQRNGEHAGDNQGETPNYYPNSFGGPKEGDSAVDTSINRTGNTDRFPTGEDDNFSQPRRMYQKLSQEEQERLVHNITDHLRFAQEFLQKRSIDAFTKVDPGLANAISGVLKGFA